MRIEKDFEDFVKQLNQEKVKYCIIGCMATNLHGRPRYTGDLDIFVEPTVENSVKMHKAIKEFGADVSDLEPDYFSKIGNYYQIGVTPVQIHISTKIDAVNFDEIWENKIETKYGKEQTYFIGLNELIKNLEATGRDQHKVDARILKEIRDKKHTHEL